MPSRQEIRRAIPWPVRRRLYDVHWPRRRRWRAAGGIREVPGDSHAVLTFDDGPGGEQTRAVLDALDAAGAPATFFVLGEHALEDPGLTREIAARGHELALHGMTHRRHDRLDPVAAEGDLRRGMEAVEEASGVRPRWYRPPFGRSSPRLVSICEGLGLTPVYWTAWGHDWEPVGAKHVAGAVLADLRPGGIVLLHDSARYAERDEVGATVAAIEPIAAAARREGLSLVTLGGAMDGGA